MAPALPTGVKYCVLIVVGSLLGLVTPDVAIGERKKAIAPRGKQAELRRFGFQRGTGRRTRRVAATTVLTEHPSSLRLLRRQFRQVKRTLRSPGMRSKPDRQLKLLDGALMTPGKQVREFERLSLRKGLATGKMIDFEGKPMPPQVIPRYVEAIERAGMKPGIEGDRFLLLRLPGATEKSKGDRQLRRRVFQTLVETNLDRLVAGKGLPIDRLIVPQTKNLAQMLEVHTTYDRTASAAVAKAVRAGKIQPKKQAQILRQLKRVQVVPLVESADTVMNAHALVGDYLKQYQKRYGTRPRQVVVFVAGSDLNRQVGPVAAQLSREVMRSRLTKLQRSLSGQVDIIPWAGNGSGPMRSGVGRFPEMASRLHPGMTFTVQPDQVYDQKNLEATVKAMGDAAFRARPRALSAGREGKLVALGASFADIHARISLRNAVSTVRLANLIAPLKQRGRKSSTANLLYKKDGQLYLRSAQPQEKGGSGTYGRTLDISGYTRQLSGDYGTQRSALKRRQKTIDRLWPKGLSDPRAIKGAFARYVQGHALTTVCGLGLALDKARSALGAREVNRLRPMITFLVKNDGFVLTRDRSLVRLRIQVQNPGLSARQVDRRVKRYFTDISSLERYLRKPLESFISTKDRRRYESMSRRLYENPHFQRYMRGKDIRLDDWIKVVNDVLPLLGNPGWNRIGWLEAPPRESRMA